MDFASLDQLLKQKKDSAAAAEAAALRLEEEATSLRQQQDQLREQVAEMRKSDEAAMLLLRQLQVDANSITAAGRQFEKRNAELRQQLGDGVKEKERLRQTGRQLSDETAVHLQQDAAVLREQALRCLQLDDEDGDEEDGTDAADCK